MPDTSPARHSRNGCAYKITRPFPAKAYILLLLFYHNWPQSTTSLLLSCEKVTQKHFHTAAPLWRQYESAFARSRGFFSINLCFTIYNFFIKLCRNFYISRNLYLQHRLISIHSSLTEMPWQCQGISYLNRSDAP